ncbi:UBN2 domain-containing protein [Cephalotus follicularis]|uniref:UBN2 domain-containing protein n=1 Tax=Cephalotus follicularis TaxID=3775 RepID=A0A1Q3B6K5_CEPFO|nr:UBN2 domain-containing protein [Cephalotus follicularis]
METIISFGKLKCDSLLCAVNADEFNRISSCDSAKEIWKLLEVTYEGTNQVKESKISMLVHQYELFMMHDYENISDMFTRFTTIINSLKNLGKFYPNQELVRRILRCLPKSWTPKVTTIKEAKGLTTLPLEQLLGSLMTHEATMKEP